ncbi:hypothetical protein BJ742DRAFT_838701 [Cladochytrium replicatum]|nr:hypothetical protein BJ742DRAFT_838701 [Cladochytrium replicatum]
MDETTSYELVDHAPIEASYALTLLCCAFAAADRPKRIVSTLHHLLSGRFKSLASREESVLCIQIVREALIKSIPTCGIPKIINALSVVHDTIRKHDESLWNEIIASEASTEPRSLEQNPNVRDRGSALFETVYGPKTQKLRDRLTSVHPDLYDPIIVQDAYGRILARDSILDFRATEYVNLVVLLAQVRSGKDSDGMLDLQVKSHEIGCQRAGATEEQVEFVRGLANVVRNK